MSFFNSLLLKRNIPVHDGRALWRYFLSDQEYEELITSFRFISSYRIDPRDATLFYAEYWRRVYDGGAPNKEAVFDTLKGNVKYHLSSDEFFNYAKQGARMLGVKWIKKQNTLYFRTLLIQGGLPLKHISQNQGKYLRFLLAVLEEQPETIEDFMFKSEIISHLPKSSQNDVVYQNCLEIVKAIMNDDNSYDELFENDDTIKTISGELRVRNRSIKNRPRLSKPKNYWLLNLKNVKPKIVLRIGLADFYTEESLSNILGIEVSEREYQFYLNDELICVFRKTLNGKYKTDWYNVQDYEWGLDSILPNVYVMIDGEKYEVHDFIQITPSLTEPTLWSRISEYEWQLVKGNGASNKEAAVLYPDFWGSEITSQKMQLYGELLNWVEFEGECKLTSLSEIRKYKSNVTSYNWTIVSKKPNWMLKSNLPVIQGNLQVFVYDEDNKKVSSNTFDIYIKSTNSSQIWQNASKVKYLPKGYIQIKIEKEGLVTYDRCFNIGSFSLSCLERSINKARFKVNNTNGYLFRLDESEILKTTIDEYKDEFLLQVNTSYSKVPTGIYGVLKYGNAKGLQFVMESPFQGMALINVQGDLIPENMVLSLKSLYGMRVLSTPEKETILSIKNKLKPNVVISKVIKGTSQPLIAFKDEILRLFYLADAMDYKNKVCIELREGSNIKTYEFSGFSHTLNIEDQFSSEVKLFDSENHLDLYAIPLNCESSKITPIPLINGSETYKLPHSEATSQFIVISSEEDKYQLMPRFVNVRKDFEIKNKDERINDYYQELANSGLKDEIWQQVLAYFNIAVQYNLPFSTFDQLRAISRSSEVVAVAFLFLGINQYDSNVYIQKSIPELEKDLGFCFHWVSRNDWENAIDLVCKVYGNKYADKYISLITSYFYENELSEIMQFLNTGKVQAETVSHMQLINLRRQLGDRVLRELPQIFPKVSSNYGIPIKQHKEVCLLIKSPIFVAEAIKGIDNKYSIWEVSEIADTIRRNIQYSHYLSKDFYKKTILHVLNKK